MFGSSIHNIHCLSATTQHTTTEFAQHVASLPQPDMSVLATGLDEFRKLPNIPAVQSGAQTHQSLTAILDRLTQWANNSTDAWIGWTSSSPTSTDALMGPTDVLMGSMAVSIESKSVLILSRRAFWLRGLIHILLEITVVNRRNSRDHNAAARHYNSLLHSLRERLDLFTIRKPANPQFPPTLGAINTVDGMCGYENVV